MARYHGKSGSVTQDVGDTDKVIPVASVTKWSLDVNVEESDATVLSTVWKEFTFGHGDYTASLEGYMDSALAPSVDGILATNNQQTFTLVDGGSNNSYTFTGQFTSITFENDRFGTVPFNGTVRGTGTLAIT